MSWLYVAKIIDAFVKDLGIEDKRTLLELLATNMARFGHRAQAEELAAIFDANYRSSGIDRRATAYTEDTPP
jgi:hypothetical protein